MSLLSHGPMSLINALTVVERSHVAHVCVTVMLMAAMSLINSLRIKSSWVSLHIVEVLLQ
jgi:hypothetical protein